MVLSPFNLFSPHGTAIENKTAQDESLWRIQQESKDSKEAMVRWLKVEDAPFGSFHGENLFLCFWENTLQLNTA